MKREQLNRIYPKLESQHEFPQLLANGRITFQIKSFAEERNEKRKEGSAYRMMQENLQKEKRFYNTGRILFGTVPEFRGELMNAYMSTVGFSSQQIPLVHQFEFSLQHDGRVEERTEANSITIYSSEARKDLRFKVAGVVSQYFFKELIAPLSCTLQQEEFTQTLTRYKIFTISPSEKEYKDPYDFLSNPQPSDMPTIPNTDAPDIDF